MGGLVSEEERIRGLDLPSSMQKSVKGIIFFLNVKEK
jgi:hypothetical protein